MLCYRHLQFFLMDTLYMMMHLIHYMYLLNILHMQLNLMDYNNQQSNLYIHHLLILDLLGNLLVLYYKPYKFCDHLYMQRLLDMMNMMKPLHHLFVLMDKLYMMLLFLQYYMFLLSNHDMNHHLNIVPQNTSLLFLLNNLSQKHN